MAALLWICVMGFLLLAGNGILSILYRKEWKAAEFRAADALVLGAVALIGLGQAAHLCVAFAGASLDMGAALFGGLSAALIIVTIVSVFWKKEKSSRATRRGQAALAKAFGLPAALFGLLTLAQVLLMRISGNVYLNGDMTVETVGSFLEENGAYLVNPMTGAPYGEGIPLRLKLLCLPTLYSVLCKIFQLTPQTVVWGVIPLVTLPCCYSAFSCVGRCLFGEDRSRRYCFLLFAAVVLWAGSYRLGMDGFGLLYCGWRGVSIRGVVLLPYLISVCLRKKWKLAVLCMMAEACIVWTFYGAGVCTLTAAGLCISKAVTDRLQKAGKEAAG